VLKSKMIQLVEITEITENYECVTNTCNICNSKSNISEAFAFLFLYPIRPFSISLSANQPPHSSFPCCYIIHVFVITHSTLFLSYYNSVPPCTTPPQTRLNPPPPPCYTKRIGYDGICERCMQLRANLQEHDDIETPLEHH